MNIVIVENEGLSALFLKETITNLGHNVCDIFSSSKALIEYMQSTKISIDLIFMDIHIHGSFDGIETSKRVESFSSTTRIVFITSYRDSETIKKAQSAKPSGYLTKPVNEVDIEVILMVIEGRIEHSNGHLVSLINGFIFNTKNISLQDGGQSIKLTNNELLCLQALTESKNSFLSKELLIQTIWGEERGTNRNSSLRELIARLRRKIPDIPLTNSYKQGYILTIK